MEGAYSNRQCQLYNTVINCTWYIGKEGGEGKREGERERERGRERERE